MENKNKKTVETLHELIEICKDGERGYKEASEKVTDTELKPILYRLSQQRALFRGELQEILIKDWGDDAKENDSFLGKLHRGWLDFRAGLSGHDTKAVLQECERGEKHAIEKYGEALSGFLPSYIEEKVQEQFNMIKGTLSQIREFKSEAHSH